MNKFLHVKDASDITYCTNTMNIHNVMTSTVKSWIYMSYRDIINASYTTCRHIMNMVPTKCKINYINPTFHASQRKHCNLQFLAHTYIVWPLASWSYSRCGFHTLPNCCHYYHPKEVLNTHAFLPFPLFTVVRHILYILQ